MLRSGEKRSDESKRDARDAKRPPSQRVTKRGSEARIGVRRVGIIAAAFVVLALVILYPVGQKYYQAVRHEQRLQAQVDAVNARNEAVKAENDALQTEEGIENQARENLGWVKEGEEAAVVTNEQGGTNASSKLPEHIDESSITAPKTWYYSILDTIFFVHE